MHGPGLLSDLVVIFGVSLLVVLLLQRLRLPTIAGFLVSGMVLGPYGLRLVSETSRIETLAEVGVILLLFTVGLEYSIASLRRLWGTAAAGALLPSVAWSAAGGLAGIALGMTPGQGLFLGFLVSLSSPVIPLKRLSDRGQIDTPAGRATAGVAVMQDLLVVPMMLLTPWLAPAAIGQTAGPGWLQPLLALGQAAAVVMGVLFVALKGVPRFLTLLTAQRSRDLFIISLFLICLGTAFITSALGLSLALGAFLAGLVVSESEYGHQALADIAPFRDGLNSLFFVSVGMLMDPSVLLDRPSLVLLGAAGIILFKMLFIAAAILMTGLPPSGAVQAGLALSQVGEFAFVLMRFGAGHGMLSDEVSQIFLCSAVLTMIVTPLMLTGCPPLIDRIRAWEDKGRWRPPKDLRSAAEPAAGLRDHVIIVGYGFNGRNLARVLKEIDVPHIVLEMNPETVRRARAEGERILYGDAASSGILESLGGSRARVLVLAISDAASTRRAVAVARRQYPALHIVVRTRYLSEVDELYGLGAQTVIPEEVETSMEIFSQVLAQYGVPREALVKHARRIRAERYGLFRDGRPRGMPPVPEPGESHGTALALAAIRPYLAAAEVLICPVLEDSPAASRSLQELDLRRATGATILAVLREGKITISPPAEMRLEAGDSVVLVGATEEVGAASSLLAGA